MSHGYRILSLQMTEEDAKKIVVHRLTSPRLLESSPRLTTYSLENVPKNIADAIIQFNTPPLAEPTEFGTMVEATIDFGNGMDCYRGTWIRISDIVYGKYWHSRVGHRVSWNELINPKLVK